MTTNLPTTKQLRYFVALEKYAHFGKAASACFVSQPAFSVAIMELENILNVQLVDRTNKSVTITRIGKEVAVQARLVLQDIEGLMDIARESQQPLAGPLNLGVIPTIAPFLLPRMLPRLRKTWPDLELYLTEDMTDRVYADLIKGDLDLILIALPYELKNVEYMTLFKDAFYLACRKDTRLLDPQNYSIDTVPDESILLMGDGHCLREHALSACKVRNRSKVSHVTASSMLTLVQMIDADLGITYLPEMALSSNLLKNTRVVTRPIKPASYREIGLVWRKGSSRAGEFRLLGEFIRQQVR